MRFLPLPVLLLLGACASQPGATPNNQATVALADISKFTVTDLQAALVDATAQKDLYGMACYPALIQFVNQHAVAATPPQVVGAFSAFQLGRDALRSTSGTAAIPDYLVVGCTPLAVSVGVDLGGLLIKLASLAAAPNPLSAMGVLFPAIGVALKVGPAAAEMGGAI